MDRSEDPPGPAADEIPTPWSRYGTPPDAPDGPGGDAVDARREDPVPPRPEPASTPWFEPHEPYEPASRLLPPGQLPSTAWPPVPGTAGAPQRPRRRRWPLVVAAVAVVLAAAGVTLAVVLSHGGTAPAAAGGASRSRPAASGGATAASPSSTAADTPLDTYARSARAGDCVALTSALDGVSDPDVHRVDCTDASATFTVADLNTRTAAKRPCRTDTSVTAENAGVVLCLQRVLRVGQCILGNGAVPFPLSAVACTTVPAAPFTQLLRLDAVGTDSAPVACAAGQTSLTLSGQNACLTDVTP